VIDLTAATASRTLHPAAAKARRRAVMLVVPAGLLWIYDVVSLLVHLS
jgi:hypothetical protein